MTINRLLLAAAGAALFLVTAPSAAQLPAAPTPEEVRASRAHSAPTSPTSAVRQIFVRQERFKSQNGRYASTLSELGYSNTSGLQATLTSSNATSYAVIAEYQGTECALYVGDIAPPRPYVERPSAVRCNRPETAASHRHRD